MLQKWACWLVSFPSLLTKVAFAPCALPMVKARAAAITSCLVITTQTPLILFSPAAGLAHMVSERRIYSNLYLIETRRK